MAVPGSRQNRTSGGRGGYPRPSAPAAAEIKLPPRHVEEPPTPVALPITPPTSTSGTFSPAEVSELIRLVHDHDITELTLERDNGAQRLVIKRERPAPVQMMMAATPPMTAMASASLPVSAHEAHRPVAATTAAPSPAAQDNHTSAQDSYQKVVAPMVGTFYRGSDPKDPPFIKEGDLVEKDQVIGIIEAMKIMNEIKSELRGRCVRVSVENGQPVEYGQTILLLEPA